ncbi:MAG: hypothetical protein AB7J47_23815 [Acidimicrobiia bacterium]
MNLYRQLDTAYQHLTTRPRPVWLATVTTNGCAEVVTAIRNDQPDPTTSDATLRALLQAARRHPDALTVALHALVPRLRVRLGRSVTDDYRGDVLSDLTMVLLDSPLDGPRLAARLVNRAHNRTHKAARSVHTRGVVNIRTVAPLDPVHFAHRREASDTEDVATIAVRRADLARFRMAVQAAIDDGELTEDAWAAYRDHRLVRVLDADARLCTSHERTTATRTARKLAPLVQSYLHAA